MVAEDARAERLSICILSLSVISDDPRVRRQGDAFHKAGWKVTAVSVPGWKSAAPAWRVIEAHFEPWSTEAASSSSTVGPVGPDRYLEVPEDSPLLPQRPAHPRRHFPRERLAYAAAGDEARARARHLFCLRYPRIRA